MAANVRCFAILRQARAGRQNNTTGNLRMTAMFDLPVREMQLSSCAGYSRENKYSAKARTLKRVTSAFRG